VADAKIYRKGMVDFKEDIRAAMDKLDFAADPRAAHKREQLLAMDIAADALILFAGRYADLAVSMAKKESDAVRKKELERISRVCSRVPAHAPEDFWEALQTYWFCHLSVITELNGWDSFCPGHLDQHLEPFFQQGLAGGSLTRDGAKELLECFFIKFNNHPAPPKVGVTAAARTRIFRTSIWPVKPGTERTAPGRCPICCWKSSTRCTCSSRVKTSNSRK
jgi:formate C-acetyltransferase